MSSTDPRRLRGPFTRWPRASDATLAAVMFVLTVFVVDAPGDAIAVRAPGDVPVAAWLAAVAGCAALYWRRRAPLAVLSVAVLVWLATLGSGAAELGGVTIIALYSTGRYAPAGRWGYAGAAAAVAVVTADGVADPGQSWGDAGFGAAIAFLAWYAGRSVRLRGERVAQRQRDQAAEARRIVAEERTRIARELHDVVAHRVSLMTVQAGAATAVAVEDPDGARQAMGAVEEAGRQALTELRHLLGVLRPAAELDGLGPQPGLADLPGLVAQVRGAGLDVSYTVDDDVPADLPDRVDLFAYRIVQESLTNVLKHAGPGTRARVRLGVGDGDDLVIEVVDDGHAATTPAPGSAGNGARGHGIVGMRERVRLLGGSLEAEPRPGGGFRVAARLPGGREPA